MRGVALLADAVEHGAKKHVVELSAFSHLLQRVAAAAHGALPSFRNPRRPLVEMHPADALFGSHVGEIVHRQPVGNARRQGVDIATHLLLSAAWLAQMHGVETGV